MDCSTPGLPVHHQLLEFIQTHVHWVGNAIQPSHPLLSPSPAFRLSQPQGLQMSQFFTSGGQSIGVSSFSPFNEYQDWFPLEWTGLISLQSKGLARVFSKTTVQKHQFFKLHSSLLSGVEFNYNTEKKMWLIHFTLKFLSFPLNMICIIFL